jgi:two-component system chemotaxis response regulator CheB
MDGQKRVLVVDDSSLVRHRLTTIIDAAPGFAVAGTASTGAEALAALPRLRPDVITLDVQMPDMDGLETLHQIMEKFPTPVLMVSSQTEAGAKTTIDALALGAVDYIAKPAAPWAHGTVSFKDDLIAKLGIVAAVQVRRMNWRPAAVLPRLTEAENGLPARSSGPMRPDTSVLVVMGCSTGGPQALDQIFGDLQQTLPAAFVVVQHMPPLFTRSLAARLNRRTAMEVREVAEGDSLQAGAVLVGQGGFHVTLGKDRCLHIDQTPQVHGVRPAIDRLLFSVAENWPGKCLVTIMTGMGVDGAAGARALHDQGVDILAQDENTSIVYGMPRAVAELGIARAVLPLDKLGPAIERWVLETASGIEAGVRGAGICKPS